MKDLLDIFLQPTPVLQRLQEKPTWALPLILLCVTSMLGTFLYFSAVDAGWFLERSLLQSNPDISEAQLKAIRDSNSDGGFLRWSATIGAAAGLLHPYTPRGKVRMAAMAGRCYERMIGGARYLIP